MKITDKMRLDWLENPSSRVWSERGRFIVWVPGRGYTKNATARQAIDAALRASGDELPGGK